MIGRYCPTCKNDTSEVVKAGEKLKASKKKAKMPSAHTESQRDWGKVRHMVYDTNPWVHTERAWGKVRQTGPLTLTPGPIQRARGTGAR